MATTVTTVTMVTMVIKFTMATKAIMHLSTTPLLIMPQSTCNPTTPHHHLTTLLADSLELQAALALTDLDLGASAKEVLAQLVLAL